MKHPVDTSQWGEFVVGELFDMIQGRRLKKADFIEGEIPYVMASSYNNGVITHISNPITTGQDLLTADIFGNVFYQPSFIGFGDDNCGLKLKNYKANKYQYLFLATVFKKFQNKASFTNKLRGSWYVKQTIKLPLKPSADPSNYSQADIDWDYMETVMERVTARAKDRLANLPQPSEKQKTPVDTSAWGEFVVGELFDNITRGTRLKKSDRKSGPTPLVTAGSENQGIAEHVLENKELFDGIALTIDMFGNAFARNYPFYADDNILVLQTNNHTFSQIQFMAGSLAHLANEYGYTNQFRQNTLNNTTIKLPLKPSVDLSNYTQNDIDWDYMEKVMKAIEEKAQTRLKTLQKAIT